MQLRSRCSLAGHRLVSIDFLNYPLTGTESPFSSYMMPDTGHMAFTVSEADPSTLESFTNVALFQGSHFLCLNTMHRTLLGRLRTHLWLDHITNAEHRDSEMYLHRMMIWVKQNRHSFLIDLVHLRELIHAETVTSRLGILHALSLIWMCISADYFDVPESDHPQTFLDQRHNARLLAWETLDEFLHIEGELGDLIRLSWSQLVAELNDRLIHKDDVISPARRVIQAAHDLPPPIRPKNLKLHPLPASVLDPANIHNLEAFYAHFTPRPTPHPTRRLNDHLPTSLFAWSNIAEGTIAVNEDGTAYRPGERHPNDVHRVDVLSSRRGVENAFDPRDIPLDLRTEWSQTQGGYAEDEIKRLSHNENSKQPSTWIFRHEGGLPNSTEEWIGYVIDERQLESKSEHTM